MFAIVQEALCLFDVVIELDGGNLLIFIIDCCSIT